MGTSVDCLSSNIQKKPAASNDSLIDLVRSAIVSVVETSAIVLMTCTIESDATLLAKSYGKQGSAVSLAKRSKPSVEVTNSRQCAVCWKRPSKNYTKGSVISIFSNLGGTYAIEDVDEGHDVVLVVRGTL